MEISTLLQIVDYCRVVSSAFVCGMSDWLSFILTQQKLYDRRLQLYAIYLLRRCHDDDGNLLARAFSIGSMREGYS